MQTVITQMYCPAADFSKNYLLVQKNSLTGPLWNVTDEEDHVKMAIYFPWNRMSHWKDIQAQTGKPEIFPNPKSRFEFPVRYSLPLLGLLRLTVRKIQDVQWHDCHALQLEIKRQCKRCL